MKTTDKQMWHYQQTASYTRQTFADVIHDGHIVQEMSADAGNGKQRFWLIKYNQKKYLLDPESAASLPLKITETKELHVGRDVFHIVTSCRSFKIVPVRSMSLRQLIDTICPYEHTHPTDFLLYKILIVASYIRRINARIASTSGFGKNSVPGIMRDLTQSVAMFNPRSVAAIEMRLDLNRTLILDEMSNLRSEEVDTTQNFLLTAGDFSTVYEKGTRGNSGIGTKDTYDMSAMSVLITYNTLDYYLQVNQHQKFFDLRFTKAVMNRFVPFVFTGKLVSSQFKDVPFAPDDQCAQIYRQILKTLAWYCVETNGQMQIMTEHHDWTRNKQYELTDRHYDSWYELMIVLDVYCQSQQEFSMLETLFWEKHTAYTKMMDQIRGDPGNLASYQ